MVKVPETPFHPSFRTPVSPTFKYSLLHHPLMNCCHRQSQTKTHVHPSSTDREINNHSNPKCFRPKHTFFLIFRPCHQMSFYPSTWHIPLRSTEKQLRPKFHHISHDIQKTTVRQTGRSCTQRSSSFYSSFWLLLKTTASQKYPSCSPQIFFTLSTCWVAWRIKE